MRFGKNGKQFSLADDLAWTCCSAYVVKRTPTQISALIVLNWPWTSRVSLNIKGPSRFCEIYSKEKYCSNCCF